MPETLDLDLTAHDLQDLSGADAVAAFFARLGYNTNDRTAQTGAPAAGTSTSTPFLPFKPELCTAGCT